MAVPVLPLLHGASGVWDDVAVFAGLMIMVGVVTFLSWRSGREKRRKKRQASRQK
jgi:hypothetical protein